jgi:hypothetical protein
MSSSPLAAKTWPTVFDLFGMLGFVYAAALAMAIPGGHGQYQSLEPQGDVQSSKSGTTSAALQGASKAGGGHQPELTVGGVLGEVCTEVKFLLGQKPMIAVIAAHVAHGYGWYVTQSWLPQYFHQVLRVELSDVGT